MDMENLAAIHKFVVDGDGAEKLYEIFKKSYLVENNWQPFEDHCVQVDFTYGEGVFRVEEKTTSGISYIAEIINFFADRGNIYSLSEYFEDGVVQSYSVDDAEGKYFVRPPKTELELQMEEMENQRMTQTYQDNLPF